MRIAELYRSRQGEGRLTGTESVFVRTSGCNLRCWFCDTPFASWQPEGDDLSVSEIAERVLSYEVSHVVLTGGEPMLFAELVPLAEVLRAAGRHITVETAGTLYLPVACDLMSVSPKLSSSAPVAAEHAGWHERHERTRQSAEIVARLLAEYDCQLKFVVDRPGDLAEIEQYLACWPGLERQRVWLMPQGVTSQELTEREVWLADYCRRSGWQYCPRRQIEWFGWTRGT